MIEAIATEQDALRTCLQRRVYLAHAVAVHGKLAFHSTRLASLWLQLSTISMHSSTRRSKGLQTSGVQGLTGHAARLVHFAHGYHHIFIMDEFQLAQGVFRSAQAVYLLAHYIIIQCSLARSFYNEVSLAIAHIALVIRKHNGHGLA